MNSHAEWTSLQFGFFLEYIQTVCHKNCEIVFVAEIWTKSCWMNIPTEVSSAFPMCPAWITSPRVCYQHPLTVLPLGLMTSSQRVSFEVLAWNAISSRPFSSRSFPSLKKKKKRCPQSCVQLKGGSQHASVELTHDCSSDAECLQGIPHPASKGQGIVQYPRHHQCPEPEPPISLWRVSPFAITLSHCKSCHPLVSSQSVLLDWLHFWDFHIFCVLLLLLLSFFFF